MSMDALNIGKISPVIMELSWLRLLRILCIQKFGFRFIAHVSIYYAAAIKFSEFINSC